MSRIWLVFRPAFPQDHRTAGANRGGRNRAHRPGGPDDPPGVNVFYVDHNVVTSTFQGHKETVVDDPEFLGDSGFPSDVGHSSFHPVAGIAREVQVAFRPAK